ncbi:MAG: esterase family protein [Firmicutes bacterium]|nr:esterase [Alicyclobacillaceae bacterium]MCL6496324.1 esterase family protein [Bacillota bacterium]
MPAPSYRVERLAFQSQALADNPLGDPKNREVLVVVPDGSEPDQPLPAVWMLPAYASNGVAFLNHSPWGEALPARLERLARTQGLPPARYILPDVFTALGGAQYLDSPAVGRYATYLWEELLPFLESQYATTRRGLVGRSSGGFGALLTAMERVGWFDAVACHSGDMGFEWCYLPDMPTLAQVVAQAGGLEAFWTAFQAAPKKPGAWVTAMNLLAMAATYSPNPRRPPPFACDLPVDPETLELDESVWRRWLAWDPVRRIEKAEAQAGLRALSLLFLDAGERDEYRLQYGLKRFARRLSAYQIPHRWELYPDNHFQTHYRFDRSLPLVVAALTASP